MTAVSRLLAAYLVLTLVPLLALGVDFPRLLVAGGHVLVAALLLWSAGDLPFADAERRAADGLLRWFPLFMVPFLYTELPLLNQALATGYHDLTALGWEEWIFGGNPAQSLAGAMPSVLLSEVLHASYISYYGLIYVPPLLLWADARRDAFDASVFTLMLTFVLCFVVFIVFPVEGPRYLFPAPEGIPGGPARGLVLQILEGASSRGTAFPSSHMAVATAQTVLVLRYRRRLGLPVALLTAGLGVGAVYGGFHYAVDILAGAIIGLFAALVHRRARRLLGDGGEGLAINPSGA